MTIEGPRRGILNAWEALGLMVPLILAFLAGRSEVSSSVALRLSIVGPAELTGGALVACLVEAAFAVVAFALVAFALVAFAVVDFAVVAFAVVSFAVSLAVVSFATVAFAEVVTVTAAFFVVVLAVVAFVTVALRGAIFLPVFGAVLVCFTERGGESSSAVFRLVAGAGAADCRAFLVVALLVGAGRGLATVFARAEALMAGSAAFLGGISGSVAFRM